MVVGLALRLDELDNLVDLVIRNKAALDTARLAPVTRESMPVATLKAIRLVMFALMRPVTTLELGR